MLCSYLFTFASLVCTALAQQHNAEPIVNGTADDGWQSFPDVIDAKAYPDWVVDEDAGGYLPVYQTAGLNKTEVTRAIIVLNGKDRTCWSDWTAMNNALYNATYDDPTIERDHISIMAPCFFTEADLKAGAATDDQLIWDNTTWISGHSNVADNPSNFSTYDVLDTLVAYYMNTTVYPNLQVVVIAGHSAGGQMTQRYVALRPSNEDDSRLHFWIANPGSLCWLTSDRPFPDDDCDGVDDFKYGLKANFPAYATADARVLEREGIIERYNGRTISYAWGLVSDVICLRVIFYHSLQEDHGDGDPRCQAKTQGNSHLERGQYFVSMLEDMGGVPNCTTVDWVPGISHDAEGMMASNVGIDKLFRFMGNEGCA
ncbi:uncharacterized protein EV420DRAFT_368640 [Desarmillaria tabescens]|uniref:Uncharacterized protein n=1 Tax=Armillaria tabescens TaxID=1929756 RepID=A0AA39KEX4_ARMTA|nr:uncharacterized protein EV420DRAFT_368640 [Desarmillaria tabescens]KAK0458636.1 hypothetical protein EV420DRAFT_368640 [Desarmillaria tabescens]